MYSEAPGSFSEGFRMNVFPHAIAFANIHMGTIAGKLNGVMPATTPERLADREHVDAGGRLLGEPALQQVRDPGRELDVLLAAGDLAHRVGQDLAVLLGDQPADVLAVLVDRLADPEQDVGALAERGRAPADEGLLRDLDRGVDLVDAREVDLVGLLAGGGVEDGAAAARLPGHGLAADPVAEAFHRYQLPARAGVGPAGRVDAPPDGPGQPSREPSRTGRMVLNRRPLSPSRSSPPGRSSRTAGSRSP